MVALRRGAFAASVSTVAACVLFDANLSCRVAFVLTYIGFTLAAVVIALSRGKIVSLLRFGDGEEEGHQFSSYPVGVIFGPYYDATSDDTINNPFA
jgi:hypothetical protein